MPHYFGYLRPQSQNTLDFNIISVVATWMKNQIHMVFVFCVWLRAICMGDLLMKATQGRTFMDRSLRWSKIGFANISEAFIPYFLKLFLRDIWNTLYPMLINCTKPPWETIMGLLMLELSLEVGNSREGRYILDVGVLARQIFVIPGSQIESDHIFFHRWSPLQFMAVYGLA